jgi:hypothetical protein
MGNPNECTILELAEKIIDLTKLLTEELMKQLERMWKML